MKTRILTFTCILILLLTFTSADAALVMGTPYQGESSVSGIQGLQIDGALYDVNFIYDVNYSGPTYDLAFADSAANAIVNEFNISDPAIAWLTNNGAYDDCFVIASDTNDSMVAYGYNNTPWESGNMWSEDYAMYAVFNTAAISDPVNAADVAHAPIPGTVVLFGSSLVLIGVIRRNFINR
jgi:hypothetical protein